MKFLSRKALAVAALTVAVQAVAVAAEPIWDANKVVMTSETLANGVYALYGQDTRAQNARGEAAPTSGGLIVGSKGALLIDTMLNETLNAQLQTINAKLGGKPILYAINTSAHGDHSFGNMYLPSTTMIVQHANTRDYIAGHLDADKAFMLKYFGAGRGIEPIRARRADIALAAGARMSIDLGDKTVEVIDFGFSQTGGDLWVWEPASKVMWSGNPIIAAQPALPWLLDGHLIATLETLKRVYAFLPPDARIVPGHGVPISREQMRWHIDYLDTVRAQVEVAVKQGLSLEQTVRQVSVPQFRGYALFDWVHAGLNVPAAYRDLAGK